ncbi:MAG TPA: ribosome maturation factor RimP [Thermoanaerobaculia bacterium]|nr:ribosome maturation factor RimP [Thermoanaerobaculia bacterium]
MESRSVPALAPELVAEFEQIAAGTGCQLEHAEYKGGVLRLVLDRPEGGVNLADCEQVSKQVSALLDVVDFGKNRYTLEVTSPGLDRPLYRPRDYARFTGRLARVTYRVPESGAKRTVVGRLEAFHPEREEVVLAAPGGERLLLHLHDIQMARLEVEL